MSLSLNPMTICLGLGCCLAGGCLLCFKNELQRCLRKFRRYRYGRSCSATQNVQQQIDLKFSTPIKKLDQKKVQESFEVALSKRRSSFGTLVSKWDQLENKDFVDLTKVDFTTIKPPEKDQNETAIKVLNEVKEQGPFESDYFLKDLFISNNKSPSYKAKSTNTKPMKNSPKKLRLQFNKQKFPEKMNLL